MRFPGKTVLLMALVLVFAFAGSAAAQTPVVCISEGGEYSSADIDLHSICDVPDDGTPVLVVMRAISSNSSGEVEAEEGGTECRASGFNGVAECQLTVRDGVLDYAFADGDVDTFQIIAQWDAPPPTPSPTITPTAQITTTHLYTLPTTGDHALYNRSLDAGDILTAAPLWAALIFWLAIIIRRAAIGRNDE